MLPKTEEQHRMERNYGEEDSGDATWAAQSSHARSRAKGAYL